MNRREFAASGSLVALGLSGVANAAAESNAPPVSAAARNLYRRALVLDCNLAPDFGAQPAESLKEFRSTKPNVMRTA